MRTAALLRAVGVPLLAGCSLFPAVTGSHAQDANKQRKPLVVNPTEADNAAGHEAEVVYQKAFTGTRPKSVPDSKLTFRRNGAPRQAASRDSGRGDDFSRIPGTLTYFGGQVVQMAESHNIYLLPNGSSIAAQWGDPETFLTDLGRSEFIHITDQYVGETANNRFTLGDNFTVPFTVSQTPLTDAQIRGLLHAVTNVTNETEYGHIYHVFLPQGQDECFDSTFSVCASNVFCAYHSSVTFKDNGRHVLYSVEPFTDVPGCQVKPGTPNGQLVDSQNSVLSHELIETITDPDGDAWFDITSGGMLGEEIGDECVFVTIVGQGLFSDPVVFKVNGHKYAIQPEWNNRATACTAER
jgi:hypothetical protein